ncbi:MAG: tRNA pseudouridine(55) synthase TruB [Andreesenia angusta]|nr:tRNA pseudouridine(55) synthase TruB [Andreesenia angusta]
MNGIINVLKPSNMTSHDIVGFMRRITRIKKIGHTGTLDPNASGVLPICIGKATRISEYFNREEIRKTYRAKLKFGYTTTTEDRYGEKIETSKVRKVSTDEIYNVFKKYTGEIEQIPPMYSAKKIGGKRLYELAREGIDIERKKRKVNIYSLSLVSNNSDGFLFDIECSSGTYIRTLCKDMGKEFGMSSHMSFLLRTKVGKFDIENSLTLDEIENLYMNDELNEHIYKLDYPLDFMEEIELREEYFKKILNGIKIPVKELCYNYDDKANYNDSDTLYRVYCKNQFIGIGRIKDKRLKMDKVLFI